MLEERGTTRGEGLHQDGRGRSHGGAWGWGKDHRGYRLRVSAVSFWWRADRCLQDGGTDRYKDRPENKPLLFWHYLFTRDRILENKFSKVQGFCHFSALLMKF